MGNTTANLAGKNDKMIPVNSLLTTFIFSVGVNMLMFFPAYFLKTDKLTDISYALTFIALAIFGLTNHAVTFPSLVLATMIFTWAIRLGSYLLNRIRKIGKDKRFDERREKFWSFATFWLLQGVTVWVVLLPSNLFFGNDVESLPTVAYLGSLIWLIGLIIEALSDKQKYDFINDPKNKGKWVNTGLWKYSRHPNYFGEILLWIGVYIFTIFGLSQTQTLIGLLGPLYIAVLIIFVSGIPLLEKSAEKKWGEDKNYQKYKNTTGVLVPFL